MKKHEYQASIEWIGNEGDGTKSYQSYSRNHVITANGKEHPIQGSSDPTFRGDPTRYNPEELFLSSLTSCHMLWYLHLCSAHKVIVTQYSDAATGVMEENETGSGRFTAVTLHPHVIVKDADMITKATELHKEANAMCFIANSCNFKVTHQPVIEVKK
ncbi:OsmC family protein [Flavobacteriaceae bacterium M23B6Z8]